MVRATMARKNPSLQTVLEKAYQEFHSRPHRDQDPLKTVHRFSNPQDQELVAFIAALLSYGNVTTILSSIEKVLLPLGTHPYQFIQSSSLKGLWTGFKHRFTTGEDIEVLLNWLKSALEKKGSLENYFVEEGSERPMRDLLSSFVKRLSQESLPASLSKTAKRRERNLKYLLSDPERGSACKRLNLFLRWVVRENDGIDLGIWSKLGPEKLILPLDTHLLQTLRNLSWTRSQQASWKVAEEATEKLKIYCPEDPIKYDFALCHLSMSGHSIKKMVAGVKNA
jgi:uncharacterized protein (TIGR02757 family)